MSGGCANYSADLAYKFYSALHQKLTNIILLDYSQISLEIAMPTSSLACIAVVLALLVDIWWL